MMMAEAISPITLLRLPKKMELSLRLISASAAAHLLVFTNIVELSLQPTEPEPTPNFPDT